VPPASPGAARPWACSTAGQNLSQTKSTNKFLVSNLLFLKLKNFKNQLKERKKISIIYGKFSKKYIKKTLIQASKLQFSDRVSQRAAAWEHGD